MYGLAAIRAANGWLITVAGISIVFVGLVILATVLANLERVLRLWDEKHTWFAKKKKPGKPVSTPDQEALERPPEPETPSAADVVFLDPEDLEIYSYFQWLTKRQGEIFSLPRLLEQAEKRGIRDPYGRLDLFLRLNLIEELTGADRGFYKWREGATVRSSEEQRPPDS